MKYCLFPHRFKASTNDHVIEALLYDDIDFVCPYYELSAARDDGDVINVNEEYYLVYLVGTYRPVHSVQCTVYTPYSNLKCKQMRYIL